MPGNVLVNENMAPGLMELTVSWGRQSLNNHTLRVPFVSVTSAMKEQLRGLTQNVYWVLI